MDESYFDNNANCPMTTQAIRSYIMGCKIGNTSCKTKLAEYGKQLIKEFKSHLANEFSSQSSTYKVIITSGGSESNSTVINNYVYEWKVKRGLTPHFVCSTVEHPSITDYLVKLQRDEVASVSWVKPLPNGKILVEELISVIVPNTACIFLQSVNSETGCVQNLAGLQAHLNVIRKTLNKNVALHVDHVQGFRRIKYPNGVGDTISISLHKIGAPLGIGVLLYKHDIVPLIAGKQNDGKRGGTYNIGAIVSASEVLNTFQYKPMKHYKQYLLNQLSQRFIILPFMKIEALTDKPTLIVFSDEECLPHTLFLSMVLNGKVVCGLIVKEYMFQNNFTIGTGTACSNESQDKSNKLGSMASSSIPDVLKTGFIRISFGSDTNEKLLKRFAKVFNKFDFSN
jgi:cysteine desulfurase